MGPQKKSNTRRRTRRARRIRGSLRRILLSCKTRLSLLRTREPLKKNSRMMMIVMMLLTLSWLNHPLIHPECPAEYMMKRIMLLNCMNTQTALTNMQLLQTMCVLTLRDQLKRLSNTNSLLIVSKKKLSSVLREESLCLLRPILLLVKQLQQSMQQLNLLTTGSV